jgi:energy-coupling factor transporter transmembrane protein EcfT
VAALVLVVHTFTTVAAAPLGHPSWQGLLAGGRALMRVAASIGLLGLYLRIASLDDLINATGWWLAPLARLGLPVADFGLVLAVAVGTAPMVLGEGRRSEMVVRLRRTGPQGTANADWPVWRRVLARWRQRATDRARLVVPMMETLGRRSEALTLSLRRRRPRPAPLGRMPASEGVGLALWLVVLVWRPW